MLGLWEVGRMTEVQNVMWNSTREAARDASTGQNNLQAVATNLLLYLQNAEPSAFGNGHTTSLIAPVVHIARKHQRLYGLGQHRQQRVVHHDVHGRDHAGDL